MSAVTSMRLVDLGAPSKMGGAQLGAERLSKGPTLQLTNTRGGSKQRAPAARYHADALALSPL